MNSYDGYRLFVDIPVGMNEDQAVAFTEEMVSLCFTSEGGRELLRKYGLSQVNYRLGHDLDRQKSNYLMRNENGHVNNKKSVITVEELDPNQQEFDFVAPHDC